MLKKLICVGAICLLSACAYKIDIRQGNYIEKRDVAKLRQNMNKDQVIFVLGKPVLKDTFSENKWYYVYQVDYGDGREAKRMDLILNFKDGKLVDMSGTVEKPEEFTQSIDE